MLYFAEKYGIIRFVGYEYPDIAKGLIKLSDEEERICMFCGHRIGNYDFYSSQSLTQLT